MRKGRSRYQQVVIPKIATNIPLSKRLSTPFGTQSIQSKHRVDNHITGDEDEDGELTPDKHTIASMSATFSAENLIQQQNAASDCISKEEEQDLEIIVSDEERQNGNERKSKLLEVSRNSSKQLQNTFGVDFDSKSAGIKNQRMQMQTPISAITGGFGIATNQSKENLASLSPTVSQSNNYNQVIIPKRRRMTSASTLRRSSK